MGVQCSSRSSANRRAPGTGNGAELGAGEHREVEWSGNLEAVFSSALNLRHVRAVPPARLGRRRPVEAVAGRSRGEGVVASRSRRCGTATTDTDRGRVVLVQSTGNRDRCDRGDHRTYRHSSQDPTGATRGDSFLRRRPLGGICRIWRLLDLVFGHRFHHACCRGDIEPSLQNSQSRL